MALTDDEFDNVTSDSESVPSPNSPELSAAGSESPPGLVEDIAAYGFGVRHTFSTCSAVQLALEA
ncbi:hypothetical protein BCON_0036g00410 [Botryotinia convoluta]|uniref:Uncharacterized protein n=1 Tax=Botryotinia convoluta TaxID=54673 RepID=A0A4Z1ILP1_9HELO|nr:hypothetical protein BCON_0036g00410 [Botryotinia convoluta]